MLHKNSVGTYQGNELVRISSGNARPRSSQFSEPLWTDPGQIGSAHFQVFRVEMLAARLEIFRSNHCGMHSTKSYPDRLRTILSENMTYYQPFRS